MNEHEPRIGDVVSTKDNQAMGVILEIIYPQQTGDRGRVMFHWNAKGRDTIDAQPLSWVRNALASGHMKLISRAESVNPEKI